MTWKSPRELSEARERQLVIVVIPPADGDPHDQRSSAKPVAIKTGQEGRFEPRDVKRTNRGQHPDQRCDRLPLNIQMTM